MNTMYKITVFLETQEEETSEVNDRTEESTWADQYSTSHRVECQR
jgi:hypothetical protein